MCIIKSISMKGPRVIDLGIRLPFAKDRKESYKGFPEKV